MSTQLQPYVRNEIRFDSNWLEQILLQIVINKLFENSQLQVALFPENLARFFAPKKLVTVLLLPSGFNGDFFRIEIVWDCETAFLTGAMAVAGGLVGGYAGGRVGAALGAGIGSAAGYGVSKVVSLRELWATVKDKLNEVLFIIFNYLRRLDAVDYIRAFDILMACSASRRELVLTLIDFIAEKLGRQVLSAITAA